MNINIGCPICHMPLVLSCTSSVVGIPIPMHCTGCGNYRISETEKTALWGNPLSERQRANASGWLSENQDTLVTAEIIAKFMTLPTPSYGERKRKLLEFLQRHSKHLGQRLELNNSLLRCLSAATWSLNDNEMHFVINSAEIDALVELNGSGLRLTAKGYDFLSQLTKNPDSQLGFCAMWFHKSMDDLWEKAIEPAIGNAGYQPHRIDKKEHNNRIDDEIFADIRRSRFVVADFTHDENGVRGGVYFEAGFAQGLGLPVIWTCREDILSEGKLHFDIRQYNFLNWTEDNLDDFSDRLQTRIEAILGRGTWKPGT